MNAFLAVVEGECIGEYREEVSVGGHFSQLT